MRTPDQDGARQFYENVVGWRIDKSAVGGDMDYRMINSANGPVAGSMTLTEEMRSGGAR